MFLIYVEGYAVLVSEVHSLDNLVDDVYSPVPVKTDVGFGLVQSVHILKHFRLDVVISLTLIILLLIMFVPVTPRK